jgi:hypothetical protein
MSGGRLSGEIDSSIRRAEELSTMYTPFTEDLMFLEVRERTERMRGLRGDRATRRAVAYEKNVRPRAALRRWWHRSAVLAG